jgi:hypothetical protein
MKVNIEKLKNGLMCCQVDKWGDLENCGECPYNEVSICVQECRTAMSRDVLELIRQMEEEK